MYWAKLLPSLNASTHYNLGDEDKRNELHHPTDFDLCYKLT